MRVSWRARQSCAERHWRAPGVLAHTCVVGGAYWIGLLMFAMSVALKAVDTIGNCQRLAFTVGVSQHMHKITNL